MAGNDDNNPPQCRTHGGCVPGKANYQNNILIPIVERILPNGAEAWCLVVLTYKEESGEEHLCSEEDLHNNWVRKLCNNFKKPTGATGGSRCIEIDCRIHCKTSPGILGASSAEDSDEASDEEGEDEESVGGLSDASGDEFVEEPPQEVEIQEEGALVGVATNTVPTISTLDSTHPTGNINPSSLLVPVNASTVDNYANEVASAAAVRNEDSAATTNRSILLTPGNLTSVSTSTSKKKSKTTNYCKSEKTKNSTNHEK